MAKKILVLLLVLGIVGILSGCDLINDLLEGEVETWEWSQLVFKPGQTFEYYMESYNELDGEKNGEAEIVISDIVSDEVEVIISGDFDGENFWVSKIGDKDKVGGTLIATIELLKDDHEEARDLLWLIWFQHFWASLHYFEEEDELFIGFNYEHNHYDNGDLIQKAIINIPGKATYAEIEGFIVDLVFEDPDENEKDNWNFCISFGEPIFLMGSAENYDDNSTALIELLSYSE